MALPRPLPSTTPHYPTPFLRAVSLSLSVLPSFYFFSLSKKNTSKFQNETNENKNRVVLFFILQKIYHIIISFTHMTYRRNTRAQSMFVVDQEIKRSIKLKLNEKTKKTNSDWIAVGIFLDFYFHFSPRSSPILQWPWFCMDTQSKQ